jgi:hypothetical protein
MFSLIFLYLFFSCFFSCLLTAMFLSHSRLSRGAQHSSQQQGNRLERLCLSEGTRLSILDFPCHALQELQLKNCVGVTTFR